jgi:hypothetical protein
MNFQFVLGIIITFWLVTPAIPPHLSLVAPFDGSIMVVEGGGDVTTNKYILGNYWIKDAKGHSWAWIMTLVM